MNSLKHVIVGYRCRHEVPWSDIEIVVNRGLRSRLWLRWYLDRWVRDGVREGLQ